MAQSNNKIPGLVLCLVIASISFVLGTYFPLIGGPVFAILIGTSLSNMYIQNSFLSSGVNFSSKYLLQVAVVLLGFGLDLNKVISVGTSSLPIIITTITVSLLIAFIAYKFFNLDSNTAILVGVGSSICGGSAIAATAPVIHAKEEEVAKSISVIFLFNILAALIFPTLGQLLGLSNDGFALFSGTAVNDTSSVTATATAWDLIHQSNTLSNATIVKLTRTLAIIPITLVLSVLRAGHSSSNSFKLKKSFPTFLVYFVLASVMTTVFTYFQWNTSLFLFFKELSKFLVIVAMASIGLKTNLKTIIKTGGRAIILGGACWLGIIIFDLLLQFLLGKW